MKTTIFLSHGDSPEDNAFTKWLAFKLIALGYEVFCDILFLDKGNDFWTRFEKEIRENTIRFLPVLSVFSNHRAGVLREVTVAEKVKKELKDDSFIIPLVIDDKLSYDDINIQLLQLDAVNFKSSWAAGLRDLLEAFEKQGVPKKVSNPDRSNELYRQIVLHDKDVVEKPERYDSNWFPVLSFPEDLLFHDFGDRIPRSFDIKSLPFPSTLFKGHLCTFAWEYDFIEQLPRTETYENSRTIRIPVKDILGDSIIDTEFIYPRTARRLIVQLMNDAFTLFMRDAGVREYKLSNHMGYWLEKGKLEKDKVGRIQLVGKSLSNRWHFGVSGSAKLYPTPTLVMSSHIFFTSDGSTLIDSDSIQHAARRRQGKNWWNDTWRKKLLAFMTFLSDGDNSNKLTLKVGSEEVIEIGARPIQFEAQVTYDPPNKDTLTEEVELSNIGTLEDLDEEYETPSEGNEQADLY